MTKISQYAKFCLPFLEEIFHSTAWLFLGAISNEFFQNFQGPIKTFYHNTSPEFSWHSPDFKQKALPSLLTHNIVLVMNMNKIKCSSLSTHEQAKYIVSEKLTSCALVAYTMADCQNYGCPILAYPSPCLPVSSKQVYFSSFSFKTYSSSLVDLRGGGTATICPLYGIP